MLFRHSVHNPWKSLKYRKCTLILLEILEIFWNLISLSEKNYDDCSVDVTYRFSHLITMMPRLAAVADNCQHKCVERLKSSSDQVDAALCSVVLKCH